MLCFDTYALMEIARDNPIFTKFNREPFVIADITLAEFYGVMLREFNGQTADYWFSKMSPFAQQTPKELLRAAVKFRYENKAKNLSFFDAVGYIFAVKNGHKFLTGDKEFEGLPDILFVKK